MTATDSGDAIESTMTHMSAIDFNKLVSSSPAGVTEVRSLSDPPPMTSLPVSRILLQRFVSRPILYFAVVAVLSTLYLLFYGFIFLLAYALPDVVSFLYAIVSASNWDNVLQNVAHETWRLADYSLSKNGKNILEYFSFSYPYVWPLYFILFIYNLADWPWDFHYEYAIPTGIVLEPWRVGLEYDIRSIDSRNLQFGHLKVQYGYNDQGLFVRSDSSHLAMLIDYSLLKSVDFEQNPFLRSQWRGKSGTDPVRIEFGDGPSPTVLLIHGAYFEHPRGKRGAERAREFIEGLRAKLPQAATTRIKTPRAA